MGRDTSERADAAVATGETPRAGRRRKGLAARGGLSAGPRPKTAADGPPAAQEAPPSDEPGPTSDPTTATSRSAAAARDVALSDIDDSDLTFQFRMGTNPNGLAASLAVAGQQCPVDLIGPAPHRIVDGFRRVAAARSLGWASIRAVVHEAMSEGDAHRRAFVKNVVRRNLAPLEKANAIRLAVARGQSPEDVAEDLGLSMRQLERYQALLRFPEAVLALLEHGAVTMAHAKVLADLGPPDPRAWAIRVKRHGWSARELRREIGKALGRGAAGRPKTYFKRDERGVRVYPFRVRFDAPEEERRAAVEAMRRAIELLERRERRLPTREREDRNPLSDSH